MGIVWLAGASDDGCLLGQVHGDARWKVGFEDGNVSRQLCSAIRRRFLPNHPSVRISSATASWEYVGIVGNNRNCSFVHI
jgi:hypothetical protein